MDSTHEPGHGTTAVTRRNITHLRDQRDRAGLLQLADTLAEQRHPDAANLAAEARDAARWIDNTSPRAHDTTDTRGIRIGDILSYTTHGTRRQGIVIAITSDGITTNHGDIIAP